MDKERRLYWLRYACDLARRLELRDWTVGIADEPSDDDAFASMSCAYGRKVVTISLCPAFDACTAEEQRHAIVHELTHAHLAPISRIVHVASNNLDKTWMRQLQSTIALHEEYAVDGLAQVMADFMPLPPVKKRKEKSKKRATASRWSP